MNGFAIGQQLTSASQSATEIKEFTSLHEWFTLPPTADSSARMGHAAKDFRLGNDRGWDCRFV